MTAIKYISNKELLAEIQRSKATYCYFTSPDYKIYDVILPSIDDLTPELLQNTILTKASKASTKAEPVDPKSINPESIVFRVMTDSHLPLETNEKKRKKSSTGEWVSRPNFPPFKHYIMKNDEPVEVGRSHWKGDFETGNFCIEHGKITDRLARMFMLLVEQYSHKGNWRSYCVSQDTEALTQRGWLGIDDITKDDIILSYDDGKLKWSKIKSIYRGDYEGKMFNLTIRGMDALVTPGHKFLTQKDGLKKVEYLCETDKIVLTGEPVEDGNRQYEDAFVEIIGWIITEGNYYLEEGRNYCRITIFQNEGQYADRIRNCLRSLNARFSENYRDQNGTTGVIFHLTKELCQKIIEVSPNKIPTMDFILSLTQNQRELLINTMLDGDGWRATQGKVVHRGYCQKNKEHMDVFLALCTMAGHRVSVRQKDIVSFGKPTQIYLTNMFSDRYKTSTVETIDFHGAKRGQRGMKKIHCPNEPTVDYNGKVWCPETEFGSFIARRNGYTYLTGNSYRSEFVASALLHLCAVGLQFNESLSSNCFAYITQVTKHVFIRILNLEKKHQSIRDDLLLMHGVNPSFTRQISDELDQKDQSTSMGDVHVLESGNKSDSEGSPVKKEAKKRGRKPKSVVQA